MRYYLAGPIDYEDDRGTQWRDELRGLCEMHAEMAFFDPVSPYHFNSITDKVAQYIHDVNMVALRGADAVVARLMKNQVSVGTPIELYYAIEHKKPIILITDMVNSVYIRYIGISGKLVSNLNEAYREMLVLEKEQKEMEELKAKCMKELVDKNGVPDTLRHLTFVEGKATNA
jgi:nucleoside 2-deoxyribosyltransferase